MKLLLDTTVFGQGFNSRSADVRLLKDFLERTHAELCVPAIVIEEALNLVRKAIEEANTRLVVVRRLTGDDQAYAKLGLEKAVKAYRNSVDVLLSEMKARILPYPRISHDALVRRALIPNKPFVSSGRGYRDSLIWFSILELVQGCDEEINFISGNTDDWCQSKNDRNLLGDLVGDLSSKGVETSRVHLFASLGEFVQQCAINTLPMSIPSTKDATRPPDYLQLLVDGGGWIETILPQALPEFLRGFSRADASVEDVEILALSAPIDIQPSPIRMIDVDRRLLQFSAKYRIALQFLIKRSDLAVWSQRVSLHQRQEWDENRLRIQATMGIRVLFRMIERGENTEDFSVVSIFPDYYGVFQGPDPVAVKLHQSEVHAPEHTTWRAVRCKFCDAEFGVGCHRLYPTNTEKECVTKLERILAADHNSGRPHENLYDLVAYSI